MSANMEKELQQVLQECTADGLTVRLPEGRIIGRVFSGLIKEKMAEIGGIWKGGKTSAFIFQEDPTEKLASLVKPPEELPDYHKVIMDQINHSMGPDDTKTFQDATGQTPGEMMADKATFEDLTTGKTGTLAELIGGVIQEGFDEIKQAREAAAGGYPVTIVKTHTLDFDESNNFKAESPFHTNLEVDSVAERYLITDVIPDPDQPRKTFSQIELADLAQSIKRHGIIQSITIRPAPEGSAAAFLIVFGERRWRASQLAGMTTIPAVLRVMSDDEARELQIIENLHRQDVHPMQEALAFDGMRKRMSLAEIADRIRMSEKYVATRLRLVKMTKAFQTLFLEGGITFQEAKEISRASKETQQAIWNGSQQQITSWKKADPATRTGRPSLYNLQSQLQKTEKNLDQARFKTEDPDLIPKMGACGQCPFNTAVNELFADEAGRICTNAPCYVQKTNISAEQIWKAAAADGHLLISMTDSPYGENEERLKLATDLGLSFLKPKDFQLVEGKSQKDAVKALVITCRYGQEKDLDKTVLIKLSVAGQKKQGQAAAVQASVTEMEQRADRGKELDDERQWLEVRRLYIKDFQGGKDIQPVYTPKMDEGEFTQAEIVAMCSALFYKLNNSYMHLAADLLAIAGITVSKSNHWQNEKLVAEHLEKIATPTLLRYLQRWDLLKEGFPHTGSHVKDSVQRFSYAAVKDRFPTEVDMIEAIYAEKEERRQKNLVKRIDKASK